VSEPRHAPEPYEDVILEEARRAINVQVSALDELRARTGVLLAAAAVSGSFPGAATADNGVSLGFWGGAAVVAFVLGVAFCVVVLWPPGDDAWTFVNSPKQLIEDWVKAEQEGQILHLFLAECLEDNYDKTRNDCSASTSGFRPPPFPSAARS
jgi:hypothetical protein